MCRADQGPPRRATTSLWKDGMSHPWRRGPRGLRMPEALLPLPRQSRWLPTGLGWKDNRAGLPSLASCLLSLDLRHFLIFRNSLWKWKPYFQASLCLKEIKPEYQPLILIGRLVAEAEAPILWPPDVKSRLIGKDPDARKDVGQEEKGMTEDEMVGWHHWLNGHEFEHARQLVMDREAWH